MIEIVPPETLPLTTAQWQAALLPWISDAGSPYLDRLFGNTEHMRAAITLWLERPNSELSRERTRLAVIAGAEGERRIVGGHLILDGRMLAQCRQMDAIALLTQGPADQRQHRRAVLADTRSLFAPVPPDACYLSKIGILAEYRGRNFASRLLDDVLSQARKAGATELRLDVAAGNHAALALYRRAGLVICHEGKAEACGLHYFSMRLDLR